MIDPKTERIYRNVAKKQKKLKHRQIDRLNIKRYMDRKIDRQTDRQTYRQQEIYPLTDRQKYK